jgi:hypothetical protein
MDKGVGVCGTAAEEFISQMVYEIANGWHYNIKASVMRVLREVCTFPFSLSLYRNSLYDLRKRNVQNEVVSISVSACMLHLQYHQMAFDLILH